MLQTMLKSKLHLARVTESLLEYEGSLSIDQDLMDAVKLRPYEKILVANMANGERFETYAIPGQRGSGVIGLNGAATHYGKVGDRLIIFAFGLLAADEVAAHRPLVLVLDERNRPVGGLRGV
jgi:aspartate 1-decarboxylase